MCFKDRQIIHPNFRFKPFFVVILKKEMKMEFDPELKIFRTFFVNSLNIL